MESFGVGMHRVLYGIPGRWVEMHAIVRADGAACRRGRDQGASNGGSRALPPVAHRPSSTGTPGINATPFPNPIPQRQSHGCFAARLLPIYLPVFLTICFASP